MLTFSLSLALLGTHDVSAGPPVDISSRVFPATPSEVLFYDVGLDRLAPEFRTQVCFPEDVFDNTCAPPAGFSFLRLEDGEQVIDTGEIPSSDNPALQGCNGSQVIQALTFGYVSNQPTLDIEVTLFPAYASGDAPGGGTSFVLHDLPGSAGGAPEAFLVDVDLVGTIAATTLPREADGVYDGVLALDTFGFALRPLGVTGSDVGVLLAGAPSRGGCAPGEGTVFAKDFDGTVPGTGFGGENRLTFVRGGGAPTSVFTGSGPDAPWSSLYLRLRGECACACPAPVECYGGIGLCPCGNEAPNLRRCDTGSGCTNSSGAGGRIDPSEFREISIGAGAHYVVTTPAGSSGLFLLGGQGSFTAIGLFDGVQCIAGGLRLAPGADDGTGPDPVAGDGQRSSGDLIAVANALAPGTVVAGNSYYVQYWYRDVLCGPPPAPCISPCISGANFTGRVGFRAVP